MKGGLLAGFVGLGMIVAAPTAHAQQAAAPASSATFNDTPPPAPVAPAPAAEPVPAGTGLTDTPPTAPQAADAPVAPAAEPAPAAAAPVATPPRPSFETQLDAVEDSEEPSTGLGPMIAGWALTGVGALNLATYPLCTADWYPRDQQDFCKVLSLGFGIGGLAVGIPLLAVGYSKRSKYNEWRSRHPVSSRLMNTQVALQNNSALLLYRGSF